MLLAPLWGMAMDNLRALIAEPHRELINISAELVTAKWLLSEYREDHTGMVTRATMRKIRDQNDAARECALRLRKAADKLPGLLDRLAAVEKQRDEAIALLREIDRHGVLSMATQKGAGGFVRKIDAAIAARKGEG